MIRSVLVLLLTANFAFAAPSASVSETQPFSQDQHVDYWIRILKAHPLKLVRKNAARNLGKMGNRDAVPVLISALKDNFPGVRVEAARALGYMGDERAFAPLYDAMSQGDRELKRTAADSVDKIKAYQEYIKKKESKAATESPAQKK